MGRGTFHELMGGGTFCELMGKGTFCWILSQQLNLVMLAGLKIN